MREIPCRQEERASRPFPPPLSPPMDRLREVEIRLKELLSFDPDEGGINPDLVAPDSNVFPGLPEEMTALLKASFLFTFGTLHPLEIAMHSFSGHSYEGFC